jgi:hypothetical protein
MAKQERERIGDFVVTTRENIDPRGIVCAACEKLLSEYNADTDQHNPPANKLMASGAVAVPNFGWFCSQSCAQAYEVRYGVSFRRDQAGQINYY